MCLQGGQSGSHCKETGTVLYLLLHKMDVSIRCYFMCTMHIHCMRCAYGHSLFKEHIIYFILMLASCYCKPSTLSNSIVIIHMHNLHSRYYNYAVSNDGVAEKHGDDYEKDYFTDVIREQAVDFINQRSKTGKPFFMYIAPPAPHRPATPAPQYNTTFSGKPAPHTPSYGYDGKDKHWLISKGVFRYLRCRGLYYQHHQ